MAQPTPIACRSCACPGPFQERFRASNRYAPQTPLRIVSCPVCGIWFINPQYSLADYSSFYKSIYFEQLGGLSLEQLIEAARAPYRRAFFSFFRDFVRDLPEAGRYLDAGAGTGIFLDFLVECIPAISLSRSVFALEPSSATGAHLRAQFAGIQIQPAMVERNTFADGFFDRILCSALVEHFVDPLESLLHLNRILKPGGKLMLLTPELNARAGRRGVDAFFKFVHTFYYTKESLTSLLHKAGFEVGRCDAYRGTDRTIWYTCLMISATKVDARRPEDAERFRVPTAEDRAESNRSDGLFLRIARRARWHASKQHAFDIFQRPLFRVRSAARRRVALGATIVSQRLAQPKRELTRTQRIARSLPEYVSRKVRARVDPRSRAMDIAGLRDQGYQSVTLDPVLLQELLDASHDKLARQPPTSLVRARKSFFSSLLDESDLGPGSPFLRVALDPDVLARVARYLRCAPFLESVDLLYSHPTVDGALESSQLWHLDLTERSLVKLFVYVTDVGHDSGPFTVLPRTLSARVPLRLPHYVDDATMHAHVPEDAACQLTGPAGTSFMVDSRRCFHRGSRCREPRLAFICYYTSGFGYYERLRAWSVRLPTTNVLQRLALGQTP